MSENYNMIMFQLFKLAVNFIQILLYITWLQILLSCDYIWTNHIYILILYTVTWTRPLFNTPPPIYLLAKSTYNEIKDSQIIFFLILPKKTIFVLKMTRQELGLWCFNFSTFNN